MPKNHTAGNSRGLSLHRKTAFSHGVQQHQDVVYRSVTVIAAGIATEADVTALRRLSGRYGTSVSVLVSWKSSTSVQ